MVHFLVVPTTSVSSSKLIPVSSILRPPLRSQWRFSELLLFMCHKGRMENAMPPQCKVPRRQFSLRRAWYRCLGLLPCTLRPATLQSAVPALTISGLAFARACGARRKSSCTRVQCAKCTQVIAPSAVCVVVKWPLLSPSRAQ